MEKVKEDLYKADYSFCFRCGICSSGCLSFPKFTYKPHEIPLTLSFGDTEKLIQDETIWLCLTCLTCTERCPQGVEVAELLIGVKNDAVKAGFFPKSLQDEAKELLRTGITVPYTGASKRYRRLLGLPSPPTPNVEELKKLAEVTGFTELLEKVREKTKKFEVK